MPHTGLSSGPNSGTPVVSGDPVLTVIADYVLHTPIQSDLAYETARYVLMDALGVGMLALRFPECNKLLGPLVPGTQMQNGARVPGTQFALHPVEAAFNIGTLIRWLDYNDTWLAREWGHPSDSLGGILAIADFLSRQRRQVGQSPLRMRDVLTAAIKAHEIQGVLSLTNSLNRVGLDHTLFVKVASTAVVTALLGGKKQEVVNAVSHAFVDNASLRVYRHAGSTGWRKSWAAGDATSRAVRLAYLAMRGEMGYPSVLSASQWGFQDVVLHGTPLTLSRSLGSYVMENVLFKVAFPAEFHAQTAVECALQLHPLVCDKVDEVERIVLTTHESAIRIIDKTGPLTNPADRDHCLQYTVAIGLLYGTLQAEHYEDETAQNPQIDLLRSKMEVVENPQFSKDYLDTDKRSIANGVQVFFKDGSYTKPVVVEYPIGHRRRRGEGIPQLVSKCETNLTTRFPQARVEKLMHICLDLPRLQEMAVDDFMTLWSI